ncbi:hypothetical protein Tco_0890402 [Tanacetum coccineum]|uniref:Reverse transcriptase domain-containing protein n=1 Tax=Tanacetum coccineum TaxID=301880 RepID=A0ABQ5C0C8_9ASTR
MNQNLYNSSGLDQFQPPQYSVDHQPPQETSEEMLQARETLMEAIQAFLKKYDHIPPIEKSTALLLAEDRFLKVKQAFEEEQNQPEIIQELLLQLIQDLQLLDEILPKQAEEKGTNKQDDDNDDDDYDEESIIFMNADMSETLSLDAITTSSLIGEPKDSLIMEDEDIDTIPEKESDKNNESSAENLVQNPSESGATSDNESECDSPIFDDSPLDVFEDNCVIFSRPLFDSYGDTTSSEYSSDDESILEEDAFSNLPFKFDVESISSDVYPLYDEVLEDIDSTNYLIDSINDFSPKIDPLLEEFVGELALINPIPPGIAGVNFDPKGDSHRVEKLSYDNSSPCPPKELNSEDIIDFFSAFPIPVEGSDFLLEETNTILSYLDDSLPELETFSFDIEEKNSGSTTTHFDYYLPIYEKFSFHDDPTEEKNSGSTTTHADISLPKYDSFHFDLSDTSLQLTDKSDSVFEKFDDELAHIISPPEYDCYYFDIEPDLGELTRVVVEDIFGEPRVHMPNVLTTLPTLYLDLDFTLSTDFSGSDHVVSFPFGNRNKTFDPGISIEVQSKKFLSLNEFSISFISDPLFPVLETLLLFSSENEDKVFNPRILVSKEEKSPHLLSHRGFKAFKNIHNFLIESPMMIYERDIPIWDVPYLYFDPP